MLLNHLDRGHAPALGGIPEVVFDASASVLAERDADRSDRVADYEDPDPAKTER